MKEIERSMHHLTIPGAFNVRAHGGPHTPWLLRCGSLDALTVDGERALRSLGATAVIDLREPLERGAHSHALPVENIPLYCTPDGPPLSGSLERVYESLLRTRGRQLTAAVAAIADAHGAVVVHCTAGKDRTGLVTALALEAGGMPRAAVIADYTASAGQVDARRRAQVERTLAELDLDADGLAEARRLHLDSPAEALGHALAVLDELGGAVQFLHDNGLTAAQLQALRQTPSADAA